MSAYLNDIADTEAPDLELDDIQGVILRGYNFEYIRYLVFTINEGNIDGARKFISKLLPESGAPLSITTAEPWPDGQKPPYCINIGITSFGLKLLISNDEYGTVKKNSSTFPIYDNGAVKGAGNVGDKDDSAPAKWWKRSGGWKLPVAPKADGSDLHIQITIYTKSAEERYKYYKTLMKMIPVKDKVPALVLAFSKDSNPLLTGLNYIHFGYKDSFSQPRLSKVPWNTKKQRMLMGVSTIDDRPIVPPYQFVIQKQYIDGAGNTVPDYTAHPLLLNGSFAAFRLLYQDVKAFNTFISKTPGVSPELVAAKMCGRWFDGTPLTVSPDKPDPTLKDFDFTNFNYLHRTPNQQGETENDPLGQVCPYAAHIRRTNPRDDSAVIGNQNNFDGTPNYASNRRIMRRAGAYGNDYVAGERKNIQRGLIGLFICANLKGQFEFIMQQWVIHNSFRTVDASPNSSGIDPLFGPINKKFDAYNDFEYLPDGAPIQPYKKIKGLERFIRTDGSLYLFLPGIEGLRHLANGTIPNLK
jgi:deferrochelatase/peroxidase EfeB